MIGGIPICLKLVSLKYNDYGGVGHPLTALASGISYKFTSFFSVVGNVPLLLLLRESGMSDMIVRNGWDIYPAVAYCCGI